jgi:transposase
LRKSQPRRALPRGGEKRSRSGGRVVEIATGFHKRVAVTPARSWGRESLAVLDSIDDEEEVMNTHYIGLDIHKKTISYCVRQADGTIVQEGVLAASREAVNLWLEKLPKACIAGMEATMFTGWVYDHLVGRKIPTKVAHSAMLKAIAAGKKKNDRVDARKISDLLRCDYFPKCHMVEREIRDRRRVLRYRNLLVAQAVRMKNKVSGLLMESGIPYNKQKLHQKHYFRNLLEEQKELMPESLPQLLQLSRSTIETFTRMDRQLVKALRADAVLAARVRRLMTVPGVGPILSLTWALETGDVKRFPSIKDAISYCGLCGAEQSSAGKQQRTPISKQRNKHLQTMLIEAAKVAPRWHRELADVYERERLKGNRNRGTLAVARKLVAYLIAVDRGERDFEKREHSVAVATECRS